MRAINLIIGKAARDPQDFYPTPIQFCRAATVRMAVDLGIIGRSHGALPFKPRAILDPGSGEGVWGQAARGVFPDSQIVGLEIDPGRRLASAACSTFNAFDQGWVRSYTSVLETDAQYFDPAQWPDVPQKYDLVIGNPPYGDALPAIIERSLQLAPVVAFLVKASFWMGGAERHKEGGLFDRWQPELIYRCLPRPYSDHTMDYCFIVWDNRFGGDGPPITETLNLFWKR